MQMITRETRVDINYWHRQGLSYREIARKTGHDWRTVKRYADNPALIGQPRRRGVRPSKLDPFLPLIESWLAEDPLYRASWIYDQLVKRGYPGGRTIVKDAVQRLKAEGQRLAYVRYETEPGRQGQVDFGEFQVLLPGGEIQSLYLFGMILGYSRALYAEFLEHCDLVSFLEAQQRALLFLGGVPAEILYDRMRHVFLRQLAGQAQMTQGLMALADHYGFTPQVCPAYAPWVKGKIERPMDFIREGFWRGYPFTSLPQANRDLLAFLQEKAGRIHGTTQESVAVRHEREKAYLGPLPPTLCDVSRRLYRKVFKDCTISVEGSRYEVPYQLVGKPVLIRAAHGWLRIYDGDTLMATVPEAETKGQLVRLPGLAEALRADAVLNARKYGARPPGKAKATLGPRAERYQVEVQHRPLADYQRLSGEVTYA